MLAISVEFLHGTFRADPDGTAGTGGLTRGEWPPAPSRLLAAMIAADGTGERCRMTDGSELEWFEQLPAPIIHAHGRPWHQRLQPRYVVRHNGTAEPGTHQEYVGRKGVQIRPGVRVTPRSPHVVYLWNNEPPPAIIDALRRRAARIGYLGAADSPVCVRVDSQMPESTATGEAFLPDPHGYVMVGVPSAGDVRLLDAMYAEWVDRGANVARAHYPALRHQAAYRSPTAAVPDNTIGTVVAWLRLDVAVSGRRITAVTSLFKDAVLSHHQELHGEPPPVLHGHGFTQTGYEIARYLALPDVGHRRSRGRIHGLALWMPPGCDPVVRRQVRDAAFVIRRLTGRGVDVPVQPQQQHADRPVEFARRDDDDKERPFAANPARWTRSSRCWVTAFPAIHERRGQLDLAEVSRWCEHAGLPSPAAFRSARTPLVHGAVDLAPVEVNRPGRPGLPYSHVMLWFEKPVPGPVVIGSGRQRGFGLCVPVKE